MQLRLLYEIMNTFSNYISQPIHKHTERRYLTPYILKSNPPKSPLHAYLPLHPPYPNLTTSHTHTTTNP